jgi:uncharacterized protein (DUF169 family)
MATLSEFYGIIISMFYGDNRQHKTPHIHARCQGEQAVFSILDGEIIVGKIPPGKVRMVQAWIEIHREDLMANWE